MEYCKSGGHRVETDHIASIDHKTDPDRKLPIMGNDWLRFSQTNQLSFFFLNGNCGNVLQEHDMEYYKRGSHRDQMNEIETIDRQNDAGRKLAIVGHDRLSCI